VLGGSGGLELALSATLSAAGVPIASSFAGIVVYRMVSSWLPMIPAAATFGYLLRHHVV
jgi:uncharacterized membrane protein YbhN (UPF0104 family)